MFDGWEAQATVAAAMLTGMGDMMLARAQPDHDGRLQIDPFRLVEAVIAGAPFIGASTMIAQRGSGVPGITTAASLLMVAVIGVAVGFGHGWLALLATLLTLAVLSVLAWMERRVSRGGCMATTLHADSDLAMASQPSKLCMP